MKKIDILKVAVAGFVMGYCCAVMKYKGVC